MICRILLWLQLLHQEANPGILYEFYAPKNSPELGPMSFTWLARSYGPCNASCGGGQQSREVVCVRTSDYEPVKDEQCDQQIKPHSSRQCNADSCPAVYVACTFAVVAFPIVFFCFLAGKPANGRPAVSAVEEARNYARWFVCKKSACCQ